MRFANIVLPVIPTRALLNFIATALLVTTTSYTWAAPEKPPLSSKDFRDGFQKGSDDARAYTEGAAKELDATFNFAKYAADGQLPPALRNMGTNAPVLYRCTMNNSSATNFSVIAPAQPLCKEKDTAGVCTRTLSWRDFLMEDLAPKNPPSTRPIERQDHFKSGERAAQNTALDNMDILNNIYMGMGIYRTLENCIPPGDSK